MKSWNPDKKIKIEIQQGFDPTRGYEVWHLKGKDKVRCIERDAQEEDIQYILYPDQYKKFQEGKYTFVVSADLLCKCFQYQY